MDNKNNGSFIKYSSFVLHCIVFCTTKWPIKSQNWNYAFYNPKKAFHYVSSTLSGHLIVQKEIMMYIFQIQCQKPTHKSSPYWTLIVEFLGIRETCMTEACHITGVLMQIPVMTKDPVFISKHREITKPAELSQGLQRMHDVESESRLIHLTNAQ